MKRFNLDIECINEIKRLSPGQGTAGAGRFERIAVDSRDTDGALVVVDRRGVGGGSGGGGGGGGGGVRRARPLGTGGGGGGGGARSQAPAGHPLLLAALRSLLPTPSRRHRS